MNKQEPILVVLAAGMGSRYGGLKQIDPVGPSGEILMDYSLYDAYVAGFRRVVFIIKRDFAEEFKETIGKRISDRFQVGYAFQENNNLPQGAQMPEDRVKPLGTAHALLCAKSHVDAPFAVINADDYYGKDGFKLVYQALTDPSIHQRGVMISYILGKTLSPNGHVARGICAIDENHILQEIVERKMIRDSGTQAEFSEDGGETWTGVSKEAPVSMNFWGFDGSFMDYVEAGFPTFWESEIPHNPLKAEYLIPSLVGELVEAGKYTVEAKVSRDQWFGVTYREDKPTVVAALAQMTESGEYPEKLWR